MASVSCRASFPDHTAITKTSIAQKKTRKKAKSKGHLVHRSAGVPPFSAWVEPVQNDVTSSAMQNARHEEMKLRKVVVEKEARLKEFQTQVRSRVQILEKMKRQEQLGKNFEAVEVVRNIVHQSSFPKLHPTRKSSLVKRDTCSYRNDSEHTILRPITRGIVAHSHEAVDEASQLLEEHAKEIRLSTKHARWVLESRSLPVESRQDELPGGVWRSAHDTEEPVLIQRQQETEIPKEDKCNDDYWMGTDDIKDIEVEEYNEEENILPQWLREEDQQKLTIFNSDMNKKKSDKKVTFAEDKEITKQRTSVKVTDKLLRKRAIEDLLKPGKVAVDSKQQQRSQMAMYRRLFMDLEREQVRENIRMKEHRKRMAEIKVEKEIARLEIEHRHKQVLALAEQEVLEGKQEEQQLQEEEDREYHKYLEQRHAKLQKSKESERFVEAMRAILREKIKSKGIHVPALCACGPSVWDSNPDTCANNCIYYKNPKEYAKALSSLLSSLEY